MNRNDCYKLLVSTFTICVGLFFLAVAWPAWGIPLIVAVSVGIVEVYQRIDKARAEENQTSNQT